jgi:hypothetical protein
MRNSPTEPDMPSDRSGADQNPGAWGLIAAFAGATFLLHLAFYRGYGYFRDEL